MAEAAASAAAAAAAPAPWPPRLQQAQNLRLGRGDAIQWEGGYYTVVGFDGRNEGYLCWPTDDQGYVDSSRYTFIDRVKAHNSLRALALKSTLPPLPPVDHTGRPRISRQAQEKKPLVQEPGPSSSSCVQSSEPAGKPPTRPANVESEAAGGAAAAPLLDLDLDLEQRPCVLCAYLRLLARRLGAFGAALRRAGPLQGAEDRPAAPPPEPFVRGVSPALGSATGTPIECLTPRAGAAELQITIPIVRPSCWKEVQALVEGSAVAFDERGLKETMTVKSHRWGAFVDRQKEKLEREIDGLREDAATSSGSQPDLLGGAAGDGGAPDGDGGGSPRAPEASAALAEPQQDGYFIGDDSELAELEQMVERMEDWKDLARYAGKSVGMAATRHGNEMRIHVMAFAERQDCSGVDVMRLSYRKSVEVRDGWAPVRGVVGQLQQCWLGRSLLGAIHRLSHNAAEVDKAHWIQLLQRPDVAKFTIALAFRQALANDGIHLEFCDPQLGQIDAGLTA